MKTCSKCGEAKPLEGFSLRPDRPGKYRSQCKSCASAGYSKYKRFGITEKKYNEMLEAQDGRCGICRRICDETLAIDHDHSCCPSNKSCGKCVRGLLCRNCNMAIGLLGDNLDSLRAAVEYLQPK